VSSDLYADFAASKLQSPQAARRSDEVCVMWKSSQDISVTSRKGQAFARSAHDPNEDQRCEKSTTMFFEGNYNAFSNN